MVSKKQRITLHERSEGRCEAMVPLASSPVWSRCWGTPVEVHHMLTRARGGSILDAVGEVHHLIHLCRRHHAGADGADAYEGGLLIDGYVRTAANGKPVYTGTDIVLKERYSDGEFR